MEGINNEALIACVEARPALWQAKHKHHKNKHMTRCLWTEVASIVMPHAAATDEVITALQKRWKSMRDKFRRLLRAHQDEKKSGAGADDVQDEVVWPFFDQLMFLRDTMEYRPTSGNLPPMPPAVPPSSEEGSAVDILTRMCQFSDLETLAVPSPSGEESQAQASTLSTVSHESLESLDFLAPVESPVLVPEASEAHVGRPHSQAPLASAGSRERGSEVTTSKGGKRKKGDESRLILDELGNVTSAIKKCKPLDDLENFAVSLVKHMREVSEDKHLDMKIQMMQLVKTFKD